MRKPRRTQRADALEKPGPVSGVAHVDKPLRFAGAAVASDVPVLPVQARASGILEVHSGVVALHDLSEES